MAEPLFDGKLRGDERVARVAMMMGYAGAIDAPIDFIERLLANAEREAYHFLIREISECARGEAARRAST